MRHLYLTLIIYFFSVTTFAKSLALEWGVVVRSAGAELTTELAADTLGNV
jgi:hypothetical protein